MEFIMLKANPFPKNQIMKQLEEHNIHINQYAEEFFLSSDFFNRIYKRNDNCYRVITRNRP